MLMYSSIAEKAENDYFFMHSYTNESFNTSMQVCIIKTMKPKLTSCRGTEEKTFEKPVNYNWAFHPLPVAFMYIFKVLYI